MKQIQRETKPEQKFWMCYIKNERPPKKRHTTLGSAATEAGRLVTKTNRKVHILEVIGSIEPADWEARKALKQNAVTD